MNVTIHIDGGARGNPGPAAAGIVIQSSDNHAPLYEGGHFLGRMTNNAAEYHSLIHAIERAIELGVERANIFSDSQLMVRQITGEYHVKSKDLKPLFEKAQRLLLKLQSWQIKHVYRQQNKRADALVNMALDAQHDVIVIGYASSKPASTVSSASADPGPQWAVELIGKKGQSCPLGCPTGKSFVFGPTTPAGLCVFAAQVAFNTSTHATQLPCPRCNLKIGIRVVDNH